MVLQCFPTLPGDAPPLPQNFDARYKPPPHREYPSNVKNAHPRDARLQFLEEHHIYLRDGGTPISESSTGAAKWKCGYFDPDDAIGKMKGGKAQRWPRRDLTVGRRQIHSVDDFDCTMGCMIVVGDLTASVLQPHSLIEANGIETYTVLSELMIEKYRGQQAAEEWFVFERGMTDEEIKAMWAAGGEEASNRGTEAHLQMQYVAEGLPHRDDPEVVIGKRFFADIPDDWEVYRTEWEILADDEDLAGSIDLLIRHKTTGAVRIYDYKRAVKLPDKMHGYGKMKPPFQHLHDCDGAKYAMQLSIYQYMLTKYYGLVIEDRVLMSIHPDRPFLTSVPYLEDEVEHYMAVRRRLVKARAKVSRRCPLTGVALHDPVVVEGGQVVDRKSALVQGKTIVQDSEPCVQAAVEQEIEENLEGPEPELGKMVPWYRLMPKQGIQPVF